MKPRLGPAFTRPYAGLPRRMSTTDYSIWLVYEPTIAPEYDTLYFDVGLGEGRAFPADVDPTLKTMWLEQTQKRADVVAEAPDRWLLIELRDNAQPSAIGRLLVYKRLWLADPPDTRPLDLALVTNNDDPDVRTEAELQGINYVLV